MNRFRIDVIEVLQLLASKSEQIDAHDTAETTIDLPEVLLEDWERVYRPDSEDFNGSFTDTERTQLNCFTDFFLARANDLPKNFNELLKDPRWNSICEFASQILRDFEKGSGSNAVKHGQA